MKIRTGFVSNSSSSSFVIGKAHLTELQIKLIHKHAEIGDVETGDESDVWSITEDEIRIHGFTIMDNFDMSTYLKDIGVKAEHIRWESY